MMKLVLALSAVLALTMAGCRGQTGVPGGAERGTGTLTILGTPQEEYIQGMARAAQAVGDTRLAEQARASLQRLSSRAQSAAH